MAKGNGYVSATGTAIDKEKHDAAVTLLKEAGYPTVNSSFTVTEPDAADLVEDKAADATAAPQSE